MSQANIQDPEKGAITDGQSVQQPLAPSQPPHEKTSTNIGDSSGPLFTTYSTIVEDDDNKMAERWQKDAEGIIIFTGLFSAVIAALVVVSIQDLRPNSQDISAFYLEKMYQLQANPTASRPSAVDGPPAFSPPSYAIWVNSLWFLSLVISLSCAMLATLLQQWARRYLRYTQPKRCNPQTRARTRAFFAMGVEKFHVSWAVDSLPTLVHLALFIFFAGLLVYLFNVHHTVFSIVVCWVALLSAVYGFITFMPLFRYDSPYYSPLSLPARYFYAAIAYTVLKVPEVMAQRLLTREARDLIYYWRDRYRLWIVQGFDMARELEMATLRKRSEFDGHILELAVESLDEDDALETLIGTIPGFYKSNEVNVEDIPKLAQVAIACKLGRFLERSLSSNSISDSIIKRRIIGCLNAASAALDSHSTGVMFSYLQFVNWRDVPHSIEVGYFLKSCDKTSEGRFTPFIRGIITLIVATVHERDDRWTTLVLDHLAISEDVLQDYLVHGDSLSLAILIHYTRLADRSNLFSWNVVQALCNLDMIDNTLPGLQHDFCALWNQVMPEAKIAGSYGYSTWFLRDLRHIYIALHQGTACAPTAFSESTDTYDDILDQPSSYPLCNISGHHTHPIQHVSEVPTAETTSLPPAA